MGISEKMEMKSERTCVICRTKKPKSELFRFLVNGSKDLQVVFDKEGKGSGRGFYICSEKCWDVAVVKKKKIRIGSDARKAIMVSLLEKDFKKMTR